MAVVEVWLRSDHGQCYPPALRNADKLGMVAFQFLPYFIAMPANYGDCHGA
jgi:hypothetical protein